MRTRMLGGILTVALGAGTGAVALPAGMAQAAWAAPAVSLVGARTSFSAGGSTGTVSAIMPAGARTGDTVIVSVTAERTLKPTLSGVSGLTTVQSVTDDTAVTAVTAYKTLTAADTTATVVATVTTIRRMSLVVVVYRNVGSVVTAIGGPTVQASGATAVTAPPVTPNRNNAVLVSVTNYLVHSTPWTTTTTPAGGWTERADVISTHPSAWNAATWLTERRLTGGAGTAQTGGAGTTSYTGGGRYFASTLALGPRTEAEYRSTLVAGVDRPTADHTGVLPDVPLAWHDNDLKINAPGLYQNLEVEGRVQIRASGVTLRNVRVHGAHDVPNPQSSLIDVLGDYSNVVVEHVTVRPDVPHSGWNSGVTGHDITLRFADISGTIDGVNVFNFDAQKRPLPTGTVLEHNYIHDLVWWTAAVPGVVHPSDLFSHNDTLQFQGGYGTVVRGNALHGGPYAKQTGHWRVTNPNTEPYALVPLHSLPDGGPHLPLPDRGTGTEANGRYNQGSQNTVMISSNKDKIPNYGFTFTDNWLFGGNQSVNGAGNAYETGLHLGSFLRNRFDRTQGDQGSGGDNTWTLSFGAAWSGHVTTGAGTPNQNTYLDNGNPVRVRY
ncbi:hypothetical protein [Actinoplanes sp. GCM10030250]|uniref:hypothetical protein n=1 Tax=Actinoplanes sp. GCM10030250 TaxID=3273376 RepID=UPI00362198DA